MDIRTQLQRKIWTDVNGRVFLYTRDYIADDVYVRCKDQLAIESMSLKNIVRDFHRDPDSNNLTHNL